MNNKDELFEIVICNNCKHEEYYGMMYWHNGRTYCRYCMYSIWEKETNYKWSPSKTDYVFPLYSDGKNYLENKH